MEKIDKDKNQVNKTLFFQYYTDLCIRSFGKESINWNNYGSCLKLLKEYEKDYNITLDKITRQWVIEFKEYLDKKTRLSINTKYSYFNKLKRILEVAYNDRLINANPAAKVDDFKNIDKYNKKPITYLTLEEVKKLVITECEIQSLKSAFLFSCLTGLYKRELDMLKWSEIVKINNTVRIVFKHRVPFRCDCDLYITPQSLKLLGKRSRPNELVFKIPYSYDKLMRVLYQWGQKAGIDKKICFETARHTFIAMMIHLGTELSVLSKLIGHRELGTTLRYVRLIKGKE